ncbi:adenylate cyclase [Leptospira levettii]|uniref:adenylate/guanylate cyclase domain-containing protein n=1 Tax=Leptospira levettii TaxID=2023178 RepID=UPI0010848363|nr:adenylate/guanylate cyclase domain-containing protein [Leptospira levettii]TGM27433.1 adenylate cyclase [Leptospira levettii]TGM29191.1 adenylate cyclase [Leptospira levettii]TGM76619.1 adenylate cyclase [Leptospira levettii]TGM83929.1 adenylate cyclase [Leptospira levettii]
MINVIYLIGFLFLGILYGITKLYKKNEENQNTITVLKSKIQLLNEELEQKEKELLSTKTQSEEFSNKLVDSYGQLSDLDGLLREINSATDLKDVLRILGFYIREKFKVPHYLLYVYKKELDALEFFHSNFPEELSESVKLEIMGRTIPVSDSYVTKYAHAYVRKRKRSFYIEDFETYKTEGVELENKKSANLKSLLIVPLYLRNKFIGTLDLLDYSGIFLLNEQQLNQIKIIADYIAGTIETGYLLDELKTVNSKIQEEKENIESNRLKLENLHKFNRKINSYSEIEDITREVFSYLKANHRVELGFILLVDPKSNSLVPLMEGAEVFNKGLLVTNFLRTFRPKLIPSIGSLYRSFQKQKPIYLKKSSRWKELTPIDTSIVESFKLEIFGHVPLVVQGQTIGIVCVTRLTKENPWTQIEFQEIISFCEQVAGAIHNANLRRDLEKEREKTIHFIRNILPGDLADELIERGEVVPMEYESVSILFTDFKNFTKAAESLSPEDLIEQLDGCFSQFDDIAVRHNFEKLKTIGDSYMAAGGIPQGNFTHPVDACLFAMEIKSFMTQIRSFKQMLGQDFWEIRIGIHTGPVVAGVVGKSKFAYDVWGDAVNTASRMESSGDAGEINLSETTYDKVKRFFECEYRGKVKAKNKGEMGMYFLKRLRPEFSRDQEGMVPNQIFLDLYKNLQIGAKIIYRQTGS